jgi:hypothetical protein
MSSVGYLPDVVFLAVDLAVDVVFLAVLAVFFGADSSTSIFTESLFTDGSN